MLNTTNFAPFQIFFSHNFFFLFNGASRGKRRRLEGDGNDSLQTLDQVTIQSIANAVSDKLKAGIMEMVPLSPSQARYDH
jgi:hypothetical protein